LYIKYYMCDVIFVSLKQNLSMVFGKYQLQLCLLHVKDHRRPRAHFYFYYALNILRIKYSMYIIIKVICIKWCIRSHKVSSRKCHYWWRGSVQPPPGLARLPKKLGYRWVKALHGRVPDIISSYAIYRETSDTLGYIHFCCKKFRYIFNHFYAVRSGSYQIRFSKAK